MKRKTAWTLCLVISLVLSLGALVRVGDPANPRLVTVRSGVDYTERLLAWARKRRFRPGTVATLELLFHALELRNQIVDPLHRVLPRLVQLAQPSIQRSQTSLPLGERALQSRVLATHLQVSLDQSSDRALQAIEAIGLGGSRAAAQRHIVAFGHPTPSRARRTGR